MKSIIEVFNDRTRYRFSNQSIQDGLLQNIYDIMKLGPTSANSCPLRIVFVQSVEAKERLYKCLSPTNVEKSKSAPVNALFAYDTKFYNLLPRLFPHNPRYREYLSASEQIIYDTIMRNSSLQAAYFMIIARSFGLACGPMSGFDSDAVNEVFFKNSDYRINFICNLGYGESEAACPKLERLKFEETCSII